MKSIRYLVIVFLSFCICQNTYAQKASFNEASAQKPESSLDEISINVTENSLSVVFRNKTLPITSIQELDNYLKENYSMVEEMKGFIQSKNDVKQERINAVKDVLVKNKIHPLRSLSLRIN